jgi:hypothetical protein
LAASVRLYIDENLSPVIAQQLQLRGFEVLSVRDLGALGDSDPDQFARAQTIGCAVVTADADFLRMAARQSEHCGIIYGRQQGHSISDWVTALELICMIYTADDMVNRIEYLW